MTPEAIQGAHERASAVVNGFACVRDQNARDVLRLCAYVAELEHAKEVLMKRFEEAQAKAKSSGGNFTNAFDDIFSDLFKASK